MKYLRMTQWIGRHAQPLTTVTPETSVRLTLTPTGPVASLYAFATHLRTIDAGLEVQIHEMPDDLSEREAVQRIVYECVKPQTPAERHVHTLFDWAMGLLGQLNPGGTAQAPARAPMDVDTLVATLKRVADSSEYRDQTFSLLAQDGTEVTLARGHVRVGKPA